MIPEEKYKDIIQLLPIVCIDAIITNLQKQFLLVKRRNEPLKGDYWVPGGRVMHFEDTESAVNRIVLKELGLDCSDKDKKLFGIYQDFFTENSFDYSVKYHTVSIIYQFSIEDDCPIKLDSQGEDYKWFDALPDRLLDIKKIKLI